MNIFLISFSAFLIGFGRIYTVYGCRELFRRTKIFHINCSNMLDRATFLHKRAIAKYDEILSNLDKK